MQPAEGEAQRTASVHSTEEREQLHAVAQLFGRLLLKELDGPMLERLREPGLSAVLREWGFELPLPDIQNAWLDERGAEYHDLFLRPETGPLVQSLWTQGRYEGDSTVRVRKLAEAAGVEFQSAAARGAAPDHLGSLLMLWAATDVHAPEIAGEVLRAHLEWALPGLRRIEPAGGFYGALAVACLNLLQELLGTPASKG